MRQFLIIISIIFNLNLSAQKETPFQFTISISAPQSHIYQVQLQCSGLNKDTIDFKMPKWMPGYYQLMDYADDVENITAQTLQGKSIALNKTNENTWRITGIKKKSFQINYSIKTKNNL